MFKLLKSEIEYYKISLIITGIILLANTYLTITNHWTFLLISMGKIIL